MSYLFISCRVNKRNYKREIITRMSCSCEGFCAFHRSKVWSMLVLALVRSKISTSSNQSSLKCQKIWKGIDLTSGHKVRISYKWVMSHFVWRRDLPNRLTVDHKRAVNFVKTVSNFFIKEPDDLKSQHYLRDDDCCILKATVTLQMDYVWKWTSTISVWMWKGHKQWRITVVWVGQWTRLKILRSGRNW